MRKRGLFFICCLSFTVFLITACGGDKAQEKKTVADTVAPYNIRVSYSPNDPGQIREWKQVIQSYFDTILSGKLNGQILVAKNGEILFEAYAGKPWLHKDSQQVMNEHSALHLASVSKTFTAMAVLKLAEEKKLFIDSLVSAYLPGFPYPGVTLRMLLNHRSGLPNYVHQLTTWGWPENKMATNHDLLNLLNTVKPPVYFPSGTRFAYCNTNYAVLALVIEQASGKPYPVYLDKYIFKPLGMNDTYVFEPKDTFRALPSYDWKGQLIPFNYLDGIYGDKNIYSTVRDLYKWDQALYSRQFLSDYSLNQAFSPYSFEKPGIKNYGLGWRMFNFPNNKKIIFHNGWWHGNNTAFQRLVQDSATVICLGSRFNRGVYSVLQLSYLFGDYPFEIEQEEGADSANVLRDSLLLKTIKARTDSLKMARKKNDLPVKKDTVPAVPVKDSGIVPGTQKQHRPR